MRISDWSSDVCSSDLDSDAFFKSKKAALFSVPVAYTPTCSAKHLPSYIEKADALKAKGIDEIACTAVNDIFVLSAWAKANDAEGKVAIDRKSTRLNSSP